MFRRIMFLLMTMLLLLLPPGISANHSDEFNPNSPVLWKSLNKPGDVAFDFAINPSNSANIYVATSSVEFPVIFTRDFGTTWITQTVGLPLDVNATAITVDPSDPDRVYVGLTNGQIYRSVDDGVTWVQKSMGIIGASPIADLVVHPSEPNIVFASSSIGIPYVYRSDDFGETWHSIALTGPNNRNVAQLLIQSSIPNRIFAVVLDEGVFISNDTGISWQNSGTRASFIAVDLANPQILYRLNCSLFRSVDGGNTWEEIPTPEPCYEAVYLDGQQPNVLYLTSGSRSVTRSTDAGITWTKLERTIEGTVLTASSAFAVDPQHAGRVYVYGRAQSASGMFTAIYLNHKTHLPAIRR